MNICIVTPIFGAQAGGAASYYNTLTDNLCQFGDVSNIVVVTENGAKEGAASKFDDLLEVKEIFPSRASGLSLGFRYFFRLLMQNILFFDPRFFHALEILMSFSYILLFLIFQIYSFCCHFCSI